jgi:hypothetical protein
VNNLLDVLQPRTVQPQGARVVLNMSKGEPWTAAHKDPKDPVAIQGEALMNKLQFASLRHEISHVVHGSRERLSQPQLMAMVLLAKNETQLSNALYNMCQADQLTKHPAPEGAGRGVKFIYGPGKVKLGAIEPQKKDMGGDATRAAIKPKAHKPLRKTAPKASRTHNGGKERIKPPAPNSVRWALASDGAFILLGTDVEIPRPAARALIEFVRQLDAGAA